MTYRVQFTSAARREFLKLPEAHRRRVGAKVDGLADAPRPSGAVKLQGDLDLWRVRIGQYRVVYQIADDLLLVTIVRVAHRRESYRGL